MAVAGRFMERAMRCWICTLLLGGCTGYRLADKIENGGDAPPFVSLDLLKAGDTSQIGPGDAVTYLDGNLTGLVSSNPVRIDLVVPAGRGQGVSKAQQQREQAAKEGQYPQRSSKEQDAQQERAAKEQRSRQQPSREGHEPEQPSKEAQARQHPSNEARGAQRLSKEQPGQQPGKQAQSFPPLTMGKYIRMPNDGRYVTYLELRRDKDPRRVIVRLLVLNRGKDAYAGKVRIFDRLPEKTQFVRTVCVQKARENALKKALRSIPGVGLFAIRMDDFICSPISSEGLGLRQEVESHLLKYEFDGSPLQPQQGVSIEFEIEIEKW